MGNWGRGQVSAPVLFFDRGGPNERHTRTATRVVIFERAPPTDGEICGKSSCFLRLCGIKTCPLRYAPLRSFYYMACLSVCGTPSCARNRHFYVRCCLPRRGLLVRHGSRERLGSTRYPPQPARLSMPHVISMRFRLGYLASLFRLTSRCENVSDARLILITGRGVGLGADRWAANTPAFRRARMHNTCAAGTYQP